jgi:hypothetical protein
MVSRVSDLTHWEAAILPSLKFYAHTDLHIYNPQDSATKWIKGRLFLMTVTLDWLFWGCSVELPYALFKKR